MNRISLTKKLSGLMKAQSVALLFLIAIVGVITYRIAENEMIKNSKAILDVYGTQVENKVENMDEIMGIILCDNLDLMLIQSDDQLKRHYAMLSLKNGIEDTLRIGSNEEAVIVADSIYDGFLILGADIPYSHKNIFRDYAMEMAEETDEMTGGWQMMTVDYCNYICRYAVNKKRVILICMSVEQMLDGIEIDRPDKKTYLWTDETNKIYGSIGEFGTEKFEDYLLTDLSTGNCLLLSHQIMNGKFSVSSYESKANIYYLFRVEMVALCSLIAFFFWFSLYVIRNTKKELIYPMKDFMYSMKKIQQGDYDIRVDENADNEEFYMLTVSFNQMLDELLHLKI